MVRPKLVLGTAQLGMRYGIANRIGKPKLEIAHEILTVAYQNDIVIWDTSPAYGDSETIIGKYLKASQERPKISSKLPSITANDKHRSISPSLTDFVNKSITGSLLSLDVDMIDYYFIHDERDFCNLGLDLVNVLHSFKKRGILDKIGISVYSPEIALEALRTRQFDIIQLPYSLFDRRFLEAISLANALGVMVFVRSIFLQGLFFLSDRQAQRVLPEAVHAIEKLNTLSQQYECSIARMALCFVRDTPGVSAILVGVESPSQLLQNLAWFSSTELSENLRREIEVSFQDLPVHILNPSIWRTKK